jgi:hypothetical protein
MAVMNIEDWLSSACADADRRGLADLKPLLESLAESTRALRSAGWDDAGRPSSHPGSADAPAPPPDGASR